MKNNQSNRTNEGLAFNRLSNRWRFRLISQLLDLRRLLFGCAVWFLMVSLTHSQQPSTGTTAGFAIGRNPIRIDLKATSSCASNLVRLSDLATISGDVPASLGAIDAISIGPSPALGEIQSWTRQDIQRSLELRGLPAENIQWLGASVSKLTRSVPNIRDPNSVIAASAASTASTIDTKPFTPAYLTPQTTVNAKRNVVQVILNYIQTTANESLPLQIEVELPLQVQQTLSLRNNIVGVSGGHAPWAGSQQFEILFTSNGEKRTALVDATISLPPSVWAAVGPLPKGRIVSHEDLKEIVLPSSSKTPMDDYFVDRSQLIGRELRRAISTGQPIMRRDVGAPRIVLQNETIEIQVVAGAIVAQTSGKALESGGQDDVIQVEVIGNKKKLVARVIGPGQVEAIAAANTLR
ncbi:MAG: flagellar basal body P-ring formation chaperone FlgA [Planctomycetota bacterium]|nr:flagellar basal body P-ring formation chaperone FlgA [Planctomycetota bacterium]